MKSSFKALYLLLAAIVIISGYFVYQHEKPAEYSLARHLRFSFTIQNTTNKLLKNAEVWVYGPVKQTSWQRTKSITADADFTLEDDDAGNQILHFKFKKFPPFSTKVITVSAIVLLSDKPQNIATDKSHDNYLANEKYIETENQQLISLAKHLKRENITQTAESNFNWVSNNIQYAGYIKDDRGALYAYKHKSGDCTEYMYLYTALNRIDAIPTRGIGGYRIKQDAFVNARDYHNWAETKLNNKWRIIDPQNKNFLQNENQYIAFRIFKKKINKLAPNTHRFAFSGDGLTLHMN